MTFRTDEKVPLGIWQYLSCCYSAMLQLIVLLWRSDGVAAAESGCWQFSGPI